MQTHLVKTANTAQTPTSRKLWTKTNHSNLPSRALSVLALLGASMANAGIDTVGGATAEGSTDNQLITSPVVRILGMSFGTTSGKDFVVSFSADELLYLNQLKQNSDYTDEIGASPSRDVMIPVAKFDICVDANLKALSSSSRLGAKASVGAYTSGSDTIDAYFMLKGNGQATVNDSTATQYVLFGSDATKTTNVVTSLSTTLIPTSGNNKNTLVTGTGLGDAIETTARKFWPLGSAIGASDITRVNGNGTAVGYLNHYHFSNTNYALARTGTANDTTSASNSFALDESTYNADQCGSSNGGVVTATIFLSLSDILANPSGTYNGTVDFDLTYA